MATCLSDVIHHLGYTALAREADDLRDAELLERFLARREEAAFAVLVRRHAPMVLGVCRRLLHHTQDAEDAFQATFLLFFRKAASITRRELLGNWLYGVAYRTASKARAAVARRRLREQQVDDLPSRESTPRESDVLTLLDEELNRLPDKYRTPLMLCELEGRPRGETAQRLGCPLGTLSSRLARGRQMLRQRLIRRGVTLTAAALAAIWAESASAAVPASLLVGTIRAGLLCTTGLAVVSAPVAALTEGVLKTMMLTKMKIATAGLLLVALAGLSTNVLLYYTEAAPVPKVIAKKQKKGEERAVTIDGFVDGKRVQPNAKSIEAGADAATKLLAASNLTDFLNPGQQIDKDRWKEQVVAGMDNMRPYLRIQFGKPREIEGNLNGKKVKYSVLEVVFFEPGEDGPICLWGRDGHKYYFANQIAGHEELVKWLKKAQEQ